MSINPQYCRLFYLALFIGTVNCMPALANSASPDKLLSRPNILLITADDLGYDDLSIHKNPYIKTPNLDALAENSVQFSDFSVTPVCSTTRAALLTGRDFYKTGVSGVHGGRDYLHRSEMLISDTLKINGYRNGLWGKWHVGKSEGYLPWDRGFDEAYYAELYEHEASHGFLNGQAVKHDKWVSEVVTDYAIKFMQDSQKQVQPFFAYVSYLAPHEPWLAPNKFVQPLLERGLRPALANLYGMVDEMDFHIGRLLQYLEESGLAENTIIIFLSDNGPWFDSSNFGGMTKHEWLERNPSALAGNKGQSWQNGIKSPLFVRWPAKWKSQIVHRYVDVKDIYPTLIDAIKLALPENQKNIDGISFLPFLEGDTKGGNPRITYIASHDVISQKTNFNQWTPIDDLARKNMTFRSQLIGLRNEQFKLLLNPAMDRPGYPATKKGFSLFNLAKDPKEKHNVIADFPEVAAKMQQQLNSRFYQLVQSHDSFLPPVYVIGRSDVSVINGFGPASTRGNTRSKAHHLSGMKAAGDIARYNIEVFKKGQYDLYLSQDSHASVGLKIKVTTSSNAISYQFEEMQVQKIGTLSLSPDDKWLQLEVVENNSMKSWSQISDLRRLFLTPKGADFNATKWPLPN